jgi:hypothetical protein
MTPQHMPLAPGHRSYHRYAGPVLQGLLEKDFRHRLDWPRLAQHPFVNLDERLMAAGVPDEVPTRIAGLEAIAGGAVHLQHSCDHDNGNRVPAVLNCQQGACL